jgi:hypothetical protein
MARFDAARDAAGPHDLDLLLGGRRLSLRFAGEAMRDAFAPAFRHLPRSSGHEPPELTICLFDGESGGAGVPPVRWDPDEILQLNQVGSFSQGGVRIAHDPNAGTITAVDLESARAFFLHPAISRIPWYERAAPLRAALHWLLPLEGMTLVHAGAIGLGGQGILLGGRSGSGKSTVAMAAALAGFEYAGDDYVALSHERGPALHSIHSTAKVSEKTMALLPALEQAVAIRNEEKVTLDMNRLEGPELVAGLLAAAIVLPRVGRGEPQLEPISGGEALRGLAPSTIFQLPLGGTDALGRMGRLARSIPSFSLTIGNDPHAAVELLAAILDHPPAAATDGAR